MKKFLIATTFLFAAQAYADAPPSEDAKKSMQAQAERADVIKERGEKRYYDAKIDLSGLPHYVPSQQLTGWVRIHGNNYLTDGKLGEYWRQAFEKFQPKIKLSYWTPTSALTFASLYYDQADIGAGHRPGFYDLLAYERVKGFDPVEITIATGSYDVAGWENSTAILVNDKNPIKGITMEQLDRVFGSERAGGWVGTNFRPDRARGPESNIRTWGQLGLTGEWADKPIHTYGFNPRYNTATDFSDKVLSGSDKWNEGYMGFAHIVQPNGKRYIEADQITDAVAKDPYGIAYNRFRGDKPSVRRLPVGATAGKFVDHTLETVQNRTYPLFNETYFYVTVKPGQKMDPLVKEFIKFVLSQEGQAEILHDGKYLPLTADVVREQLKKLE